MNLNVGSLQVNNMKVCSLQEMSWSGVSIKGPHFTVIVMNNNSNCPKEIFQMVQKIHNLTKNPHIVVKTYKIILLEMHFLFCAFIAILNIKHKYVCNVNCSQVFFVISLFSKKNE